MYGGSPPGLCDGTVFRAPRLPLTVIDFFTLTPGHAMSGLVCHSRNVLAGTHVDVAHNPSFRALPGIQCSVDIDVLRQKIKFKRDIEVH